MQPEPDTQVVPPRDRGDVPVAARTDEPLILRRWVGRYELIHRVAHGGMATVYLGRAKGKAGFEKIVAVKVIHPHLAAEAEFVGMFLDEARIAARIHHPHVVEILDLGESDGVYFMVMEFVEGENLAALIRALGRERLPVAVILQLLADTLEGLAAAHELRDADGTPFRLVHRDVSPHNILINLDGWAKVGDFGVMKAAGKASSTKTGELRGKLAYMSPEQARGDGRVDHRTDLFALGVVAWELLTGERLFACATEAATLDKVMACEVPPIADARPELDRDPQLREGLEALLGRALAASPAGRWDDANAMLAEVKRLLRLASELEPDPRTHLGALMRRFFLRRVDYARAALRHSGSGSGSDLMLEATAAVVRSPSGAHASLAEPIGAMSSERPVTGSQPGLSASAAAAASGTNVIPQRAGPSQWLMWLLLPMLGAGIAVALMLAIGPDFMQRGGQSQRDEPNGAIEGEPVPGPTPQLDGELGSDPRVREAARSGPTTIAAGEYPQVPKKPPGTIRWWFSTSPNGAQLFIDGEARGTTPTFVNVPTGEEQVEIRLELDGYEPHLLQLPPVNDQTFTPQLRPLARETSESDTPAKTAKKTVRKSSKPAPVGDPAEVSDDGNGKKAFVPLPDSLRDSGG